MGKFGIEEGSRIAEIARRIRASQQQAEVQNYKDEPLEDFIVRVNPALSKPTHFGKKVLSLLNRVKYRDRIRLLWSVPPGHAKSWTVMYLIAQCLSLDPKLRVAYITHTEAFAFRHSRQIRDICEAAGVQLSKTVNAASLWETTSGGSLTAMGVGGAIMGMRFDLIVVDDPYASRPDAESPLERARTAAFFNPGIVSRVGHPKRSSIIVIHCVAKDERVLMANGEWKPIQDVSASDIVLSRDGDSYVPRKVLAQRSSGRDNILRVATERKELRVNARHPFLLESGEWCKAGDMTPGMRVVVSTRPAGEEYIDPEKAWLFGFMMGDGWANSAPGFTKKPDGRQYPVTRYYTCVAKSVYPELNERVLAAFDKVYGVRPALTNSGYYRTNVHAVAKDFIQLGLVGGAHGKRIPDWVYRLRPDLKIAYLRGHCDADGNVLSRSTDSRYVASVSQDLIDDIRRLAISAGVRCGRISKSTQVVKAPNSKEAAPHTIYKLCINFSLPPDEIETIREVVADGDSEVFDLTVETSENFIAEGFVVHNTRYHPEDLIGDISAREAAQANVALREGWDYINLPAINDGTDPDPDRPIGAPLWPQQWPLDELLKKQAENDYEWASLYMGQPRPRGGAVFNDVHYYEQLPQGEPRRTAIGIDLAYTSKTYSDYSVVISAALYGDTMYILNFRRKQMEVKKFAAEIRSEQIMRPGATTYWAVGPIERPIAQLLQTLDLRIHAEVGRGGKFERAQFVATAWNNGKVLLPKGAPWLDEFTKEVLSFTGLGDKHDDVVDALANAHYPLLGRKFAPRGVGQTRLPIY